VNKNSPNICPIAANKKPARIKQYIYVTRWAKIRQIWSPRLELYRQTDFGVAARFSGTKASLTAFAYRTKEWRQGCQMVHKFQTKKWHFG
jgi:hypothetical protein